jgi:shikimate kinase
VNLILFGFPASGKTHFGKQLAHTLHIPFVDTDHLIEETYRKQFHEPFSCRQIAKEKGGSFFRSLEKKVVTALSSVKESIISIGGGALLDPENISKLSNLGTLVYLIPDKEVIKQRILSSELPYYLDPEDPKESFEDMFIERSKIFESIKGKYVDLKGKMESQILEELKLLWGKLHHGK